MERQGERFELAPNQTVTQWTSQVINLEESSTDSYLYGDPKAKAKRYREMKARVSALKRELAKTVDECETWKRINTSTRSPMWVENILSSWNQKNQQRLSQLSDVSTKEMVIRFSSRESASPSI